MHRAIEPAIHYWGTPVVLVSSLNPDGTTNLAPMSSAWWLGWSCMLGLGAGSATARNLRSDGRCVLNLPSEDLAPVVNRLALTTGRADLPPHKRAMGYRHEADKFACAGLSRAAGPTPHHPQGIAECPVRLEGVVTDLRPFGASDPRLPVPALAIEVRIDAVHVDERLQAPGHPHRIDADRWKPLFMSFRHLFGRGPKLEASVLARGPEEMYAPWKRAQAVATAAEAR